MSSPYDLRDFFPSLQGDHHSYCHYHSAMTLLVTRGKMLKFSNNHENANRFIIIMHVEWCPPC